MYYFSDKHFDTKKQRIAFERARKAEHQYAVLLRKVARACGDIVKGFDPEAPGFAQQVESALARYAQVIEPWARTAGVRMLREVARRDEEVWSQLGKLMGRALKKEIQTAPTGALLAQLLNEQVKLITSLPLDAAQRVHKLTTEATYQSTRAREIAAEIMKTGQVTKSRANLIARTEVARTASSLTMVRSVHVGSIGYVWRTSRDADVRRSHRQMEGKFVEWSTPPTLSDGTVTHAGMIYNCRCYPEPVLPERFD